MTRTPTSAPGELAFHGLTVGVAALALWARSSRVGQVFDRGDVLPVEVDCYYHLLRIQQTAQHFPHTPVRDPWINWPAGAGIPWPPGFDQAGALFALATGHGDSSASVARAAAWFPVVLGLAAVLAVMRLTSSLLRGHPARKVGALVAGALAALIPQSVAVSMVGRIDHHIAETLAILGLIAWTSRAWTRAPGTRAEAFGFEAVGALLAVASVHAFAGSVLYLATATGVLCAARWADRDARRGFVGTGSLGLLVASAALMLLARPLVAGHGRRFDHLFASYLQPSLVLAGGVAVAISHASASVWRGDPRPRTVAARVGFTLLAAIPLVLLCALVAPGGLAEIPHGLSRWLARRDPYMASIAETQPLLASRALWTVDAWRPVYEAFGFAGCLAAISVPTALVSLARRDIQKAFAFMAFTLALGALTLTQMRFGRAWCALLAVCTGVAFSELVARVPILVRSPHATAAALVALVLADPRARVYLRVPRPAVSAPLVEASRFLRDSGRPVVRGARAGVLSTWEMGFPIEQLGRHPIVVSGFGPYLSQETFDDAEAVWRGTEDNLVAWMDRRDLGYVVAGLPLAERLGGTSHGAPFVRGPDGRGAFNIGYFQSVPLAPLIVGGTGAVRMGVGHLAHLMPRFASTRRVDGLVATVPVLWVYERVAGARIVGSASEGERVTARLAFTVGGAALHHTAWTVARGGRFELTVALPTRMSVGALQTGPHYGLRVGERAEVAVEIPERVVRAGEAVSAPTSPSL